MLLFLRAALVPYPGGSEVAGSFCGGPRVSAFCGLDGVMDSSSGSFDEFYSGARDRLVAALAASVGDVGMAADAVDEAMARAYARWGRLSGHPEPAGWVFVTARNVARRAAKRGMLRRLRSESDWVDPPAGETWLIVGGLSPRQREAVVLRHLGGLTEPAIAEVMGVTRGTVSSTLSDAYRVLRAAVSDELSEERS
ncbi:MAG: sigma factor-like helix-turn-helix DNA-binding protein [Actinomycetota bacterium]